MKSKRESIWDLIDRRFFGPFFRPYVRPVYLTMDMNTSHNELKLRLVLSTYSIFFYFELFLNKNVLPKSYIVCKKDY